MIKLRKSSERGKADHGWLQSQHTFSFADYHDPQQMGFSALRVINEDHVAAAAGFPTHGHRDMEIITYVVAGALEHKDSLGTTAKVNVGDVQRMSAGTGVRHSEYNSSKQQPLHLLQIWINPDKENYLPSYDQKNFSSRLSSGEMILVASNNGRDASVSLNQDTDLYALKSGQSGEKILNTDINRSYWLQVIKGIVIMNDLTAGPGDALRAQAETRLHFKWQADAEFLLFDLP